jgi:uncharacterized membrane protein
MNNRNAEMIAPALIVAMFAVAIWMWPSVPARIPIHWNIHGQIDGYGSKFAGLLLMPLVALGGYLLIGLGPKIKPDQIDARTKEALSWIALTYVMVMAGVFAVVVAAARGSKLNMNYVLFPLLALNLIAIANLIVQSARAKGSRTPPPPGGAIRV